MRHLALGALLLLIACDGARPAADLSPPTTATTPSSSVRSFRRPNWTDADHDCQSTRMEVLAAEATGPLAFEDDRRCKISRGTWRCPYTGELFDDPHELDIDHLVPLKNAWESGANSWTEDRWRSYANELEHPEHLVAVSASANRSKGDRGPDEWLPPLAEYRCTYVQEWVGIKLRWGLGASRAETEATERVLALCDTGQVPPLPQLREPDKPPVTAPDRHSKPSGACCKVCHKGKACGDTCIARDKTCNAAPGCACEG